ncbi:hypothetical protein ET33_21975 [Paenibacillus tyrfis]|uniref:TOTE conflict system primase domain-containing protein n=1 Tax=Paenibacillus tyrfis TaxID=1501230 RepID=A0A081NVV8_9BACL|nr:hypothetical protein ET33_21975 [Paenibacillus tyrfis]
MGKNNNILITKFIDLYLIQRGHYLIQREYGHREYTQGKRSKNTGKKYPPLLDGMLNDHFQGKCTVGTFSGEMHTKFITFDIDYSGNLEMSKQVTNRISEKLSRLHIPEHYISFSGKKGYHIDIFFDDLIQVKQAKKFHKYICEILNLNIKNVEFRPTNKQGIKLPLGIHQETGNYCGFCYPESLRVMSKEESENYFLRIKKIQSESVLDLIGSTTIDDDYIPKKKDILKTEDAISNHIPLKDYESSKGYSIDRAQDLFLNGLKFQGSRHSSVFQIALYLKYCGMDAEQAKTELYTWMEWQDKTTYTTNLPDCYKDIDQVVKDVFSNDKYHLSGHKKNLSVSLDEINWIIKMCKEKNQKLITYALLIHSKRYATMNGIFFFPIRKIMEATGLASDTVQKQLKKLEGLKVLEVVERDRRPKGKGLSRKLPNLYRMPKIESKINDEEVYTTEKMNDIDLCLKFYFSSKDLKEKLTKRQYKSIVERFVAG